MLEGTQVTIGSEQVLDVDASPDLHREVMLTIDDIAREEGGWWIDSATDRSITLEATRSCNSSVLLDKYMDPGVYQLTYDVTDHEDPEAPFNAIQNEWGFYDNCVLDHSGESDIIRLEADNQVVLRALDRIIAEEILDEPHTIPSDIQSVPYEDRITRPNNRPGADRDTGPVSTDFPEPDRPDWYQNLTSDQKDELREKALRVETTKKEQELANDPNYVRKLAEQKIDGDPEYQRDLLTEDELPFNPKQDSEPASPSP